MCGHSKDFYSTMEVRPKSLTIQSLLLICDFGSPYLVLMQVGSLDWSEAILFRSLHNVFKLAGWNSSASESLTDCLTDDRATVSVVRSMGKALVRAMQFTERPGSIECTMLFCSWND
jgi:hypothetical protein